MRCKLLFLCFAVCFFQAASAAPGIALGAEPRYGKNFTHFDYVNPAAPRGGVLTVPATGRFDALNPFTLKGTAERWLGRLTLDTLMEQSMDEPFAQYGLLADDVQVAADGLSVTFRLNPRARFHNGDPVLAKDVVYSFELLTRDPAAQPLYRFYWAGVAQARAVDAHTVRFDFHEKNSELHMILGQLPVFSHKSFPQGLAEAAGQAPIGSGPYRLGRVRQGYLAEFTRDENYWADDLPVRRGMFNFTTIRVKYYQDETARVEALKAGEYDVISENVARLWARAYPERVLKKRGFVRQTFVHRNGSGMQGFAINLRRPALQNPALRRALILAFDFESVNRLLFYGIYRRSNSFFTNTELAAQGLPEGREREILESVRADLPAEIFSRPAVEPPASDPHTGIRPNLLRARDVLLAAGYRYRDGFLTNPRGQRVTVEFLAPAKIYERAAGKWQRDLAKIGITLDIRISDAALFQKRMHDFDYDMAITVYGNSLSPGNEQLNYHSCAAAQTPGSQNYAGICHPAVEKILPYLLNFRDRGELVAASQALDRILRHEDIIVPNWYSNQARMIYRSNLHRPAQLPLYYEGLDWAVRTWWTQ